MSYYLECTQCDNLIFNRNDCSCPLCGQTAEPRVRLGMKPAVGKIVFAPEYANYQPIKEVQPRVNTALPTRFMAASLLLLIALMAIGMVSGDSEAMEACQRSHSYDVCFSSLNP